MIYEQNREHYSSQVKKNHKCFELFINNFSYTTIIV